MNANYCPTALAIPCMRTTLQSPMPSLGDGNIQRLHFPAQRRCPSHWSPAAKLHEIVNLCTQFCTSATHATAARDLYCAPERHQLATTQHSCMHFTLSFRRQHDDHSNFEQAQKKRSVLVATAQTPKCWQALLGRQPLYRGPSPVEF